MCSVHNTYICIDVVGFVDVSTHISKTKYIICLYMIYNIGIDIHTTFIHIDI